jgi:hypothetical protein
MIKQYNNVSMAIGAPGLVIQTVGVIAGGPIGILGFLAGTALLLVGLAYYAKAKGQHPVWCLFGLGSIVGLVVLSLLPDRAKDGQPPPQLGRAPHLPMQQPPPHAVAGSDFAVQPQWGRGGEWPAHPEGQRAQRG